MCPREIGTKWELSLRISLASSVNLTQALNGFLKWLLYLIIDNLGKRRQVITYRHVDTASPRILIDF